MIVECFIESTPSLEVKLSSSRRIQAKVGHKSSSLFDASMQQKHLKQKQKQKHFLQL